MFEASNLVLSLDAAHASVGRAHSELLALLARLDEREGWREEGARDAAHWLGMRYGISEWKARRWLGAAHALARLPRLREALEGGELGIDKVVELARFATPDSEERSISWAKRVSCGAIRRRGDLAAKAAIEDVVDAHRTRSLAWWYFDEGRRFGLEAELPAAEGAIVARALERLAETIPTMPDDDPAFADARRADALVAMCSARIADDADPDRATVVIHAQEHRLDDAIGGSEIEGGPVIHPETVRRRLCNARVQTVLEGERGDVLALGRTTREPTAAMLRQIRYRDRECRFPGCGTRRFTEAHHIVWWRHGGRTDLDNLALICSFHHRLVHELGWTIRRETDGEIEWFHPDGTRYRAGPSPGDRVESALYAAVAG